MTPTNNPYVGMPPLDPSGETQLLAQNCFAIRWRFVHVDD
jgi:hypothetical protein